MLSGKTAPLAADRLDRLFSVPQDRWIEVDDTDAVEELCARGLLLTNSNADPLAEWRRRDDRLTEDAWRPDAALYHFATRSRDSRLRLAADEQEEFAEVARASEAAAERFVERFGPAPPHFHSRRTAEAAVELPRLDSLGQLYDTLGRRKTTRGFDRARAVTIDQLSLVLYEVFGCQGYEEIRPEIVILKKTSPSAGGLHPIEAYPLVRNVAGVAPGLYHYSVRDHALSPIAALTTAEAADAMNLFTGGQRYFASAGVAFLLTARFRRSFWKYRQHPTAYATILMDAAHLSQTFYLVCTEIGLGAFFTNVINGENIEERLGLDGYEEGAIAVCGCGVSSGRSRLEGAFLPYVPRETSP